MCAAVKRVPRGRVASYGLIGRVAGHPNAARHVGRVMRLCTGVPWWRVIAADGRIVIQNPEWRREQVARLEAEGIEVSEGRVDYARYAWRPKGALTVATKGPRGAAVSGARR